MIGQPSELPSAQVSYFDAYSDGVQAARKHDYTTAVRNYKQATLAKDATPHQRALAYDALGYAYYRANDMEDAHKALASALSIELLITARVNQIKVMCGEEASPEAVRGELSSLRQTVKSNIAEQRYVEDDKELFSKCSYASISKI
jgi:hypothetical protein